MEISLQEIITAAQTAIDTVNNSQLNESSTSSGIYVVMWVTLIVWGGLFLYLLYLDRQIKKIKSGVNTSNISSGEEEK